MKFAHLAITAGALALSVNLLSAQSARLAQTAPNIVVILGDDMPPTHLGAYGGTYRTPQLDRLADAGIRFDQAFCVSAMCTPSRYSLMSGKYPGRTRTAVFLEGNPLDDVYSIAWNTGFAEGEVSMGRLFTELGYQTGFAGKWHLTKTEALEGLPEIASDADIRDPDIQALLAEQHRIQADYVRKVSGFEFVQSVLWENFDNDGMPVVALREHHFEWILNGALEFLDQVDPERPFLMLFASTAVHGPTHHTSLEADPSVSPAGAVTLPKDYYPTREQILQEVQEQGDAVDPHIQAGMLCLDYQIAGIRQKLKERGLEDNTLILYFSDHGIEPGKATSYLRGTRIPFIATWLGKEAPVASSDAIVQIPDVLPTLWDLATDGAAFPEPSIDGVSFADVIREGGDSERDFAYFENGYTRSVYRDGFHYIAWRYPDALIEAMRSGELQEAPDHLGTFTNGHSSITMERLKDYWDPDQLYALESDPYELENVWDDSRYADVRASLRSDLESVTSTFDHPFPLEGGFFQYSAMFDQLKQPRLERGTSYIYWYHPGMHPWPPAAEAP